MRCLTRNKVRLYAALYDTKDPILDDYGNETGQYTVKYRNPQPLDGNVSAAKGETSTLQFGEDESYDRVIVLEDPKSPIDEYTVLWIDSTPALDKKGALKTDEDGNIVTPWDYIVKKVARSLNSVSIAVSKVNVNG
jgi:hypothetical protein